MKDEVAGDFEQSVRQEKCAGAECKSLVVQPGGSLECLLGIPDIGSIQVAQQIHKKHERNKPRLCPADRAIEGRIRAKLRHAPS